MHVRSILPVLLFLLTRVAAAQPTRVDTRDIEELKRQIADETRSSLELLADVHRETGDLNNRLDYVRYGGQVDLRRTTRTGFYARLQRTDYRTLEDAFDGLGTNVTVGVRGRPSESLTYRFEIGGTTFSTHTSSLNASGTLELKPVDSLDLYATASRSNVEETLLSATGLRPAAGPFAGQLVGRVMDNRFSGGARYRFASNFDVFGEAGFGNRAGSNIDSNFMRRAAGGVGANLWVRAENDPVSLIRVGYGLDYFGFDEDRLGFGGASLQSRRGAAVSPTLLGSDGISPVLGAGRPGIGGYFSPRRFTSHIARVDLHGRPGPRLRYELSGFVGAQSFTGSATRAASGISGGVTIRLTDRLSLPLRYAVDNVGPFTQQSFLVRLVLRL
jgi:hypothetical protein